MIAHTADPKPKAPQSVRKVPFEGYRAIAALCVLWFHVYQFTQYGDSIWPLAGHPLHYLLVNTEMAVDLFFVLSAFLLAMPFVKAALGGEKPRSTKVFLLRRITRIVPTYYLVLLFVWSTRQHDLPGYWDDLVGHLTFTHVWSTEHIFWTIGPAWSLGVEMHFYLALAILGAVAFAVCQRLTTRAARLRVLLGGAVGFALIGVLYKIVMIYFVHARTDDWAVWFNPVAQMDILGCGLVLAVLAVANPQWTLPRKWRFAMVGTAFGLVVVAGFAKAVWHMPHALAHTVLAIGAALLIATPVFGSGTVPKWLRGKTITAIGTASYSLFLWHEPIMTWLGETGWFPSPGNPWAFPVMTVVVVAVSVPVALLSYRLFEVTGQRLRDAFDENGHRRRYHPTLSTS